MTRRRRVPWQLWSLGALLAFALAAVGALGVPVGDRESAWWHTLGEVLMSVGTIVGLVLAFTAATEHSIERLREDLGGVADDLSTIRVVLERIARHLGA